MHTYAPGSNDVPVWGRGLAKQAEGAIMCRTRSWSRQHDHGGYGAEIAADSLNSDGALRSILERARYAPCGDCIGIMG